MLKSKTAMWCLLVVIALVLFAFQKARSPQAKRFQFDSSMRQSQRLEPTTAPATAEIDRDVAQNDVGLDDFAAGGFVADDFEVEEIGLSTADDRVTPIDSDALTLQAPEFPSDNSIDSHQPAADQINQGSADRIEFGPQVLIRNTTSVVESGNDGSEMELQPQGESEFENDFEMAESTSSTRSFSTNRAEQASVDSFVMSASVQQKVAQQIEHGKALARRGAIYSSKKAFTNALKLVAQAMDFQLHSKAFSTSLYQALVASQEADDFYSAQAENHGIADVAAIIEKHDSNILSPESAANMSAVEAMQAYYAFVQEKLVHCGGRSAVGSEALYCLGKLHSLQNRHASERQQIGIAKSMVYHRAAMQVNPQNYKSANELAVLLVQNGRWEQAKQLLIHSLKVKQVPAAWENLSFVHNQLGETQLAQAARNQHQRLLAAPPSSNKIRWVNQQQFAKTSAEPFELRQQPKPPVREAKQTTSGIKDFIKRVF